MSYSSTPFYRTNVAHIIYLVLMPVVYLMICLFGLPYFDGRMVLPMVFMIVYGIIAYIVFHIRPESIFMKIVLFVAISLVSVFSMRIALPDMNAPDDSTFRTNPLYLSMFLTYVPVLYCIGVSIAFSLTTNLGALENFDFLSSLVGLTFGFALGAPLGAFSYVYPVVFRLTAVYLGVFIFEVIGFITMLIVDFKTK